MRPAHSVAVGVVFACAMCLIVRYIATPLPLASRTASIPTHASTRLIVTGEPLPSELPHLTGPALSSDLLLSSPSGEGADRGILLVRRCLALAEHDPLAALEMADTHQLEDFDTGLTANLLTQWAVQDFDRAYEWIKAQEPDAWREDILARFAYVRAQADPIAAARLVATDMSAGPTRDEAVISVVHQWALQDMRGARLWARSLPDESLRRRASAEVAGLASAASSAKPIR